MNKYLKNVFKCKFSMQEINRRIAICLVSCLFIVYVDLTRKVFGAKFHVTQRNADDNGRDNENDNGRDNACQLEGTRFTSLTYFR